MTIDMVFTDINLIGAAGGWEVGEWCELHPRAA
jgi:hypothetical protein